MGINEYLFIKLYNVPVLCQQIIYYAGFICHRFIGILQFNGKIFFLFLNFYLFILIFIFLSVLGLHCCVRAFSSCGKQGLLFVVVCGFLIAVTSLVVEHGLQVCGLSSCGTWAQQLWLTGSRAQAQQLWCTGLVAPQHVGSSRTRDRTRVPCIGRRILNHCATREVLPCLNY